MLLVERQNGFQVPGRHLGEAHPAPVARDPDDSVGVEAKDAELALGRDRRLAHPFDPTAASRSRLSTAQSLIERWLISPESRSLMAVKNSSAKLSGNRRMYFTAGSMTSSVTLFATM